MRTSLLMCPGRAALTATRFAMKIASSMSWVTKRTVLRSASQMPSSSSCIRARVWLSSAPNGSSRRRTARAVCTSRATGGVLRHRRFVDQRARQRGALLHPARELLGVVVLEAAQAHALDEPVGEAALLG